MAREGVFVLARSQRPRPLSRSFSLCVGDVSLPTRWLRYINFVLFNHSDLFVIVKNTLAIEMKEFVSTSYRRAGSVRLSCATISGLPLYRLLDWSFANAARWFATVCVCVSIHIDVVSSGIVAVPPIGFRMAGAIGCRLLCHAVVAPLLSVDGH